MRLVDLNPQWVSCTAPDGTHRERVGVNFDCPKCVGDGSHRIGVLFTNPVDGRGAVPGERCWARTGDTFEDLTIEPSIVVRDDLLSGVLGRDVEHWHGFVTNGEVTP